MPPFHIYSSGILIGHSALEKGDPPMSVAFGLLVPTEHYSNIQKYLVSKVPNQINLALSVTAPDGHPIQCVGIGIEDYSQDVGPEGIEVTVLGISDPPYAELFPHHVALYEKQFPSAP